MNKKKKTVDIVGEKYTVNYRTREEDIELDGLAGYVNYEEKVIVVDKTLGVRMTQITLRHEVIHAFLFESGLSTSTLSYGGPWATNEEMVDFFASQWGKLNKIFEKLEVL